MGLACAAHLGIVACATFGDADELAEAAGIAFQLTRSSATWRRPRAAAFDCRSMNWHARAPRDRGTIRVRPHVWAGDSMQVERARDYFRRRRRSLISFRMRGRGIFQVMSGLYRQLLDEVAARRRSRGAVCSSRSGGRG